VPELGLFPLGVVLLPGELLPLHIFEPRYKELIGECLEEEREFGLLLADDHGLRSTGTRAAVVEVGERFEDGRLNILVRGGDRFRVLELTSGRSFQTAKVEPVLDEADDPHPAEAERVLELYHRVAEVAGAEADELDVDEQLSFAVGARVDFGVELKQRLLESTSETERLRLLAGLLETAAAALASVEERRRRAQGDGAAPLSG
jgi:Lon protease-like protein